MKIVICICTSEMFLKNHIHVFDSCVFSTKGIFSHFICTESSSGYLIVKIRNNLAVIFNNDVNLIYHFFFFWGGEGGGGKNFNGFTTGCENQGVVASNILVRCFFRSTYNKCLHPMVWATLHSRYHISPLPHLSLTFGIAPRDFICHITKLCVLAMNIWWIDKGNLHNQSHEQWTDAASNMYLHLISTASLD